MRYAMYLLAGEKDKWLNLEVTLGPDQAWIDAQVKKAAGFLNTYTSAELSALKTFSGITDADLHNFKIHNRATLIALLLKLFVDRIGINIIKEVNPVLGDNLKSIYLSLAELLYVHNQYPNNLYIHHVYRRRGTPKTWLTLPEDANVDVIAGDLQSKIRSIVIYVNHKLQSNRRYRTSAEVDGNLIFVLTKYTGPRAALSLNKNVEVASASHTFIVLNKTTKQIGVVSGSHKEIGSIHYYLRYRLFPNQLAPRRNELMSDGNAIVKRLLAKPTPDDGLILKTLEVRNADLPDSPNFKLASQNDSDISAAADRLKAVWQNSQLGDVKNLEYYFLGRTIGLYSRYDYWDRVIINTRSGSITNAVESGFLDRIKARLGGIDIKTTRLIQNPYTHKYILDKLIGQKTVSVDPAIPEDAEEALLKLLDLKLIARPASSVKRICFKCFMPSWADADCANCGSSDMRIIGEYMSLELVERELMKQVDKSLADRLEQMVGYVKQRQRSNYKKHVVSITSEQKSNTLFLIYVGSKLDMEFIDELIEEGFGVVAIVDPKMNTACEQLSVMGADSVGLVDVLEYLLYGRHSGQTHPLLEAIDSQNRQMLQRLLRRARESVGRVLNKPIGYRPTTFEIDLKNMLQALVPDVVRLGTEKSGEKVPDGYLRYGLTAYSRTRKGRLFGWDAKYSQDSTYALSTDDLKKQKGYIKWLMDPSAAPYQFGSLGIYAIISNFSRPDQFETVMNSLAGYTNLPKTTRIAVVEDILIAKIVEWSLANWEQVLVNNSAISRVVFTHLRRKTNGKYTVSSAASWPMLKEKLDVIIQ